MSAAAPTICEEHGEARAFHCHRCRTCHVCLLCISVQTFVASCSLRLLLCLADRLLLACACAQTGRFGRHPSSSSSAATVQRSRSQGLRWASPCSPQRCGCHGLEAVHSCCCQPSLAPGVLLLSLRAEYQRVSTSRLTARHRKCRKRLRRWAARTGA